MEARNERIGNDESGVQETVVAGCGQPATLQDLPNELLEMVLSQLDVTILALRVRQVCRRWRDLVDEGRVMRRALFTPGLQASDEYIVRVLRAAPKLRRIFFEEMLPGALQAVCENCKDLREIVLRVRSMQMLGPVVDACPRLERVELTTLLGRDLTPCPVAEVAKCPHLRELCVRRLDVPEGVLSAVSEGCPLLRGLDLDNASCDPRDLTSLLERRGAQLVTLGLTCCYGEDCLLPLVSQRCRALRTLSVHGHRGPSDALEQLFSSAVTRGLRYLRLTTLARLDRQVTAALFRCCSDLTTVKIGCEGEIDDALTGIGQLGHLQFLDISFVDTLTDRGVAHIVQCTTLRKLFLDWCDGMTEESFRLCCENLPHLEMLRMGGVKVREALLRSVPLRLKRLKGLVIEEQGLGEVVAAIKRQMPDLRVVMTKRG